MKREIIDLEVENMLFDDSIDLYDYVWEGNMLIPAELIKGY